MAATGPDSLTIRFATPSSNSVVEVDGVRYPVTARDGELDTVVATGLHGRIHKYRLLVDGSEVAARTIATWPESSDTLRFLVYGDTRDGGDLEGQLVARLREEQADLALYTGDVVPEGGDDSGWRNFLNVEEPLLSELPVLFAVGNHELYRDPAGAHIARYLTLPSPTPSGDGARPGFYYEQRIGQVVFLVLDGNDRYHEQALWMEGRLKEAAATRARHVFVVLHQPPFSVGTHCGAAVAEAEWVALFERYGVRAVFAGHDHAYERLERRGVRYFVSGGGGAPLYPEEPHCPPYDQAAKRVYRAEHHFLRVELHGDDVQVTALPLDARAQPLEVTRFGTEPVPAALSGGPPIVRGTNNPLTTHAGRYAGLALAMVLTGAAVALAVARRKPRV